MKNIEKYLKHLPNCNIMQNWSEAEMALADTPESLKDESWHLAYNEMREKMKTCTCGLKEVVSSLKESEGEEDGKLYPCPYSVAVTCTLMDSCKGCETWAKYLVGEETPRFKNQSKVMPEKSAAGESKLCSTCKENYLVNGLCLQCIKERKELPSYSELPVYTAPQGKRVCYDTFRNRWHIIDEKTGKEI